MAKARFNAHIRPQGTVGENARRIIRARLTELYIWAQYVHDERRIREQHQLRIAAKRLRYTLELFREFLPEQAGDAVKELKGVQDTLGLLHDCDVLISILRSALFVPNGETTLLAAIPEAQDLPSSLLEVLGQAPSGSTHPLDAIHHAQTSLETPGQHGKRRHRDYKNDRTKGRGKGKKDKGEERLKSAEAARSRVRPNAEQRAGLKHFLEAKEHERGELYQQFVKRWDKLEKRDFRTSVLQLVEDAGLPGHARLYVPQHAKTALQT